MLNRRTVLGAAAASPFVALRASGSDREPLKYLQIGTGHAHANKIKVYDESPDWEVVGVVEPDETRRGHAEASDTFGKFRFLELEEGLQTDGISAVGIETEVRDLLTYGEMAIDAGHHIHLDKPAGSSLEDFDRLMSKADAADLVVQMGYMYRYNPAIQLLHQLLKAGALGEVFETHAVMSKVIPEASRQELDEFEGGTMFELGCHIIDLTIGVLGRPNSVHAYPRRTSKKAGDSLVDNMLAVLEYPGATATVRSTGLEVEGFSRRHFVVCGTEGTCHIQPLDRPAITLSLAREVELNGTVYKKGKSEVAFQPPYQRYVGDAADLAAVIRKEKENPYPSDHELAVQDTVLKASGM